MISTAASFKSHWSGAIEGECTRLDSPHIRAIRVPAAIQAWTARRAQVFRTALQPCAASRVQAGRESAAIMPWSHSTSTFICLEAYSRSAA